MKEIIKTTEGFTKVDEFNIKMAQALKKVAEETITVQKVAVGKDEDVDHKETASAAFVCAEGIFGTISNTVVELAYSLIDIIDEAGAPVKVQVNSRKSNSGRDYLVLTLVG